jgi:hypothetical protein
MELREVEKVMVAPIEGLQVLTKRCIGCEEDYAARLYSYGLRGVVQVQYIHGIHVSRCLVTYGSGLAKRRWQHCIFGAAPRVPSHEYQGEKPRSSPY